ncbi:MAG: hypothetical protein WA399_16520 [Acidobacteriaceae bacterium]
MKDRVILLTSTVLAVTVALFAWFTWSRWGTVGIYPVVGRIVIGAGVFALAFAGLFALSRRGAVPAPPKPGSRPSQTPGAARPAAAVETCQEAEGKTKVTTVEIS